MISVIIGEVFGHYFNDWLANRYIAKHHGREFLKAQFYRFFPY